jgi:hypothetical protein
MWPGGTQIGCGTCIGRGCPPQRTCACAWLHILDCAPACCAPSADSQNGVTPLSIENRHGHASVVAQLLLDTGAVLEEL